MEGVLDLQKILKPTPFPQKKIIKKKVAIVTMKEEDEEGWKGWKKFGGWWNSTFDCTMRRNGTWFVKNAKKQGKFQLIETL